MGKEQILKSLDFSISQKRVLILLMQGKTNAEIAKELFVGEKAIKAHVNKLYKLTGQPCRAKLIVHMFNLGWEPEKVAAPEPTMVFAPAVVQSIAGGLPVGRIGL